MRAGAGRNKFRDEEKHCKGSWPVCPPVSGLSPVPAHLNMPALLPCDLSLFTFLKIIDNCWPEPTLSNSVDDNYVLDN